MNLKQRLKNRCHLLITATEKLLNDLEHTKFAEDQQVSEDLKQKFKKYFTQNILTPVQNLQASLQQTTDDRVSKEQAEVIQKIVAYLFRFREERLREGQCKNHRKHFELLLHTASNQLDIKLNELSALASLVPLRPEEQTSDSKVLKTATMAERNSYLEKLKAVYQDRAFSGVQHLFDDEVMSIEDYYVNLALIKEEEQKKKEQEETVNKTIENDVLNRDEATELFGSAEQFFAVQEPVELKNIFDPTAEEEVRQTNRLLIIGRAGIGKTTLCQYIVNQWALGKLWNERYQAIFRIPLRNLIASRYIVKRDYSLTEIINRECFADRLTMDEHAQLETTLKNHPENYLIILDGYDELSTQAEDDYLVNQVKSLLQYPEVIVTSRPQSVSFAVDKKLEILGFTSKNIERYVEHFFKDNKQAKTNLKQQLKQQSLLQSLAHIPLNLELICSAWQKNHWDASIIINRTI